MSIQITNNDGKLSLKHASGSTAELYLFGATLTSFKTADGQERLFVSGKAALDGSKAIRGGVPICWPTFGPAPGEKQVAADSRLKAHSALPQHGFARTSKWTISQELPDGVELALEPTDEIKKVFPQVFRLTYTVTLSATAVRAALKVANPSSTEPLLFQALLHAYFHHPDPHAGRITPFKGLTYTDKTRGGRDFTEDRAEVTLDDETDRVYHAAPDEVTMTYGPAGKGGVKVKTEGMADVTVWNPGPKVGGNMADMEDKGWERYICVEPGYVEHFFELGPGKTWVGALVAEAF